MTRFNPIIVILILLLNLFLFSSPISAAGGSCFCDTSGGGSCAVNVNSYCDVGYQPICNLSACNQQPMNPSSCTCSLTPNPTKGVAPTPPQFKMCETIADADLKGKCLECVGEESDRSQTASKVWTALGCIPVSPQGFTSTILQMAVGMGGGVSLLLMVYGAFLVATSAGNPESAQKGREVFTGAITGLLFVIFSIVIMKIIGVDILQLPAF